MLSNKYWVTFHRCLFTIIRYICGSLAAAGEKFDGTLVSAEEKLAKPNPAIYERLFEKFHLKAEECFFIDDRQDNIDSAKGCGMDGYCFADGNVERLRAYMEEMEIL